MNRDLAQTHIDACNAACKSDRRALLRAAFFALGSINTRFEMFIRDVEEAWTLFDRHDDPAAGVQAVNERFGRVLHGSQKSAMKAVARRLQEFHSLLGRPVDLHERLCGVRGLGPVKAAFVVQIATGELACIDRVNADRLAGVTRHEVLNLMPQRVDGAHEYRQLCKRFDAVQLWADWCAQVGKRDRFDGGADVSSMHVRFVTCGAL